MKYFIKYFSFFMLFIILIFGLSIHYNDYEEQKVGRMFQNGKYKFANDLLFTLNDSLIKKEKSQEYENMTLETIKLHQNTLTHFDEEHKEVTLKNKAIDMTFKYEIQDSLVFKVVRINLTNINYCEN